MADSHRSRGLEPFGFWPNSTLRAYSSGDGVVDYERAVRDSEEVRKERGVIRISDIAYASDPAADPARQSLDIYMREGLTDAPVILYVHGGGWVRWDKQRALFKPAFLVPNGYLFASMNYRFHPEVGLSEMAQDVATAAAWLKQHAAKYGGDGSRLVLMGHSAGGHLVSVVGSDKTYIEKAGASLRDINGVVAIDTAMLNVPNAYGDCTTITVSGVRHEAGRLDAGFTLASRRGREGHPSVPAVHLRRPSGFSRASFSADCKAGG